MDANHPSSARTPLQDTHSFVQPRAPFSAGNSLTRNVGAALAPDRSLDTRTQIVPSLFEAPVPLPELPTLATFPFKLDDISVNRSRDHYLACPRPQFEGKSLIRIYLERLESSNRYASRITREVNRLEAAIESLKEINERLMHLWKRKALGFGVIVSRQRELLIEAEDNLDEYRRKNKVTEADCKVIRSIAMARIQEFLSKGPDIASGRDPKSRPRSASSGRSIGPSKGVASPGDANSNRLPASTPETGQQCPARIGLEKNVITLPLSRNVPEPKIGQRGRKRGARSESVGDANSSKPRKRARLSTTSAGVQAQPARIMDQSSENRRQLEPTAEESDVAIGAKTISADSRSDEATNKNHRDAPMRDHGLAPARRSFTWIHFHPTEAAKSSVPDSRRCS